jgi:hypothetical protein
VAASWNLAKMMASVFAKNAVIHLFWTIKLDNPYEPNCQQPESSPISGLLLILFLVLFSFGLSALMGDIMSQLREWMIHR